MVTICQMSKLDYSIYDEVWAIVRSLKYANPRLRHVPDLSPSWELFKKYLKLRDEGRWNEDTFRTEYVPQFLRELKGAKQQELLKELFSTDKHICLVCFCPEEELCHRSIVGGVLQGAGCAVNGLSRDYSYYFGWYKDGVPGVKETEPDLTEIKRIESVNTNITYLYKMDDLSTLFNDNLLTMFFTGRRPKDLCWYSSLKYKGFVGDLAELLYNEFYVKRSIRRYVTGGAQGFDQLSFWAVHQLKTKYRCKDIQNVLFVPFEQQETRWAKTGCFSQDEYWKMVKLADHIVVISDTNSIPALFERNHAMCDVSDYGLGLYPDDSWRTNKGGTSECLRYAVNSSAQMLRLGYDIDSAGLHIGSMVAI